MGLFLSNVQAQDGEALFNDNCTACHKIGGKLVGPDLVGVAERRSEDWIKSFVTNSTAFIASGDKEAKAIFDEYNQTEMTAFQGSFNEEEMTALVDYLKIAKPEEVIVDTPPVGNKTPVVETPKGPIELMGNAIFYLAITVILILLFMIMGNLSTYLINNLSEEELNNSSSYKFFAMFDGDFRFFTGRYIESSTEGHSYDGIRELDNTMPPWLQGIFYITIFWAIAYLVNFHIINPENTQLKEYQDEMTAAAEKYGDMDIVKIEITHVTDASKLDVAKETFISKCAACHLTDGGGSVGPNLTDEYWLNGGSLNDVFTTIRNGVPAKGMISWKGQLSDEEILSMASYIKNLKGTIPVKAKEAQGDKYVE